MKIERADVLWQARGKHWDYLVLLSPRHNCTQKHEFGELLLGITQEDVNYYGRWDGRSFVAKLLVDPAGRRDSFGRRIMHRLAWFVPNDRPPPEQVPIDWAESFLEAAAGAFGDDQVFGLEKDRVRRDGRRYEDAIGQRLRQILPAEVSLSEGVAPERWVRLDIEEKKSPLSRMIAWFVGMVRRLLGLITSGYVHFFRLSPVQSICCAISVFGHPRNPRGARAFHLQ